MSKRLRIKQRGGRERDVWPVLLLLAVVLMPAVCLLWFMSAAMRNERWAAEQKLADAYRTQLASMQLRLEERWESLATVLTGMTRTNAAPSAFAASVRSGLVDSVLLFDSRGNILYPNAPMVFEAQEQAEGWPWIEAHRLEYVDKDFVGAAKRYATLAEQVTNVHAAARALQAQARCYARAGREADAVRLIMEAFQAERFDRAEDPQGRVIAANAELMALELIDDPASVVFQTTARRLRDRLVDYGNPTLAGSQRLFLMKELRRLSPESELPTLNAEILASSMAEFASISEFKLGRANLPDHWQVNFPEQRFAAFFSTDRLITQLGSFLREENPSAETEISLLPPETNSPSAFVVSPAGESLPGWRLALAFRDPNYLETATAHRTGVYLWTGMGVVAAMGMMALLTMRSLRRRMALAQLKNDLTATVSHELKTPLASMRVLVDTLLDSDEWDEAQARDYLRLIARENERLSRVIHNFLAYSRMERKKHTFVFVAVPPKRIVDASVEAVRDRLVSPGCRFECHVDEGLPEVMADPDALVTALINLLDNAHKFTEDIKRIELRVRAENRVVRFSVRDNGIGIARRDLRKLFHPFQQIDARLSRRSGGCGLGLSIVRNIVEAHGGDIGVESVPRGGSTFYLSVPTTAVPELKREEVA